MARVYAGGTSWGTKPVSGNSCDCIAHSRLIPKASKTESIIDVTTFGRLCLKSCAVADLEFYPLQIQVEDLNLMSRPENQRLHRNRSAESQSYTSRSERTSQTLVRFPSNHSGLYCTVNVYYSPLSLNNWSSLREPSQLPCSTLASSVSARYPSLC